MLSFLQRHRGLVIVGALLLLPLVMLYAQTRRGGGRGPVVGAVLDVASVVERGLLWASGGLLDTIDHYVSSVSSWDELSQLRRERQSVQALQARVEELSIENEHLRALANATSAVDGPRPLGARVIGRSGQPLTRLLTIDRGANHGVARGDGVIAEDGIVGVVLAVGRYSSDVLVMTDPTSAIDVVVQHSRARGIIRGRGDDDKYAGVVEDFDRLRDVKPGDAVVTSGIGARFPVGMMVGNIIDIDDADDLTVRALIKPAVQLDRVEHVAVLVGRDAPRAPALADDDVTLPPPIRRVHRAGRADVSPLVEEQAPPTPLVAPARPSSPAPVPPPAPASPAPASPAPAVEPTPAPAPVPAPPVDAGAPVTP